MPGIFRLDRRVVPAPRHDRLRPGVWRVFTLSKHRKILNTLDESRMRSYFQVYSLITTHGLAYRKSTRATDNPRKLLKKALTGINDGVDNYIFRYTGPFM